MVDEGNAPDRVPSLTRSEILNPASVAYDNQNVSAFRVGDIPNSFSPNLPPEQHGPGFGKLIDVKSDMNLLYSENLRGQNPWHIYFILILL
jgi:hypothetical protein